MTTTSGFSSSTAMPASANSAFRYSLPSTKQRLPGYSSPSFSQVASPEVMTLLRSMERPIFASF